MFLVKCRAYSTKILPIMSDILLFLLLAAFIKLVELHVIYNLQNFKRLVKK